MQHTNEDLKRLQSLSLEEKVQVTIGRMVNEIYGKDFYRYE